MSDRGEGRLDGVGRAQVDPVLGQGGKEREQPVQLPATVRRTAFGELMPETLATTAVHRLPHNTQVGPTSGKSRHLSAARRTRVSRFDQATTCR